MVSASATFTVGNPYQQQQVMAPSVDNPIVNTNSSLNYPTYVPVSVPAPIPSKEAAITNVNMPQQVLPGSSFSIIVSVTTYIAGASNYVVNLTIPQLQLNQSSAPMTLSNNAVGTTTFNVSLPITARGLTANGTVTGQLSLTGGSAGGTVDGVPINFMIGGTSLPTPVGVVPTPIQPVPLGPVARPVIGAVPLGPGAVRYGYQGYVFGRGGGRQRHQWDFMPHTLNPRQRYGYQGVLGVDYTLACSDQSVANAAGTCANGTRAVVSPITSAPTPPPAPVPAPVTVPTSTDTGLPPTVAPPPVATPVTPTVTPATPVSTPVVTAPTPPVVTPPVVVAPTPPTITPPTLPTLFGVTPPTLTGAPSGWQSQIQPWIQQVEAAAPHPGVGSAPQWRQFAHDLRDVRTKWNNNGKGWAWGKVPHSHAYQAIVEPGHAYQATQSNPVNQAVILATMMGDVLHLDAHGFAPNEPVQVDLNIPMSRVSKSSPSMADSTGHLAHDYKLSKPPGKQYIAALRVTGMNSKRVGFKSVQI